MTESGDDKDLREFMNRDSDVSRRYRSLAIEEPPADIDRAVLAQARAAVKVSPPEVTRLPARRRTRWMVPFAVAATVLLSFAIFREAGVNTGVLLQEPEFPTNGSESLPARVERELPVATIRPEAVAPTEEVAKASAPGLAAAPPPPAQAAPPPPAPALAPAQDAAVARQASESREQAKVAGANPPAGPPVTATANAIRPTVPAARQVSADRTRGEVDVAKEVVAPQEALAPEAWLEEIRKLRAGGHAGEADAELARFLELNPEYFDRNPDVAKP